jgi:hypothetical protein
MTGLLQRFHVVGVSDTPRTPIRTVVRNPGSEAGNHVR